MRKPSAANSSAWFLASFLVGDAVKSEASRHGSRHEGSQGSEVCSNVQEIKDILRNERENWMQQFLLQLRSTACHVKDTLQNLTQYSSKISSSRSSSSRSSSSDGGDCGCGVVASGVVLSLPEDPKISASVAFEFFQRHVSTAP
ncbi:hypothetical protein Esti_003429 [Eimeria stiedai]